MREPPAPGTCPITPRRRPKLSARTQGTPSGFQTARSMMQVLPPAEGSVNPPSRPRSLCRPVSLGRPPFDGARPPSRARCTCTVPAGGAVGRWGNRPPDFPWSEFPVCDRRCNPGQEHGPDGLHMASSKNDDRLERPAACRVRRHIAVQLVSPDGSAGMNAEPGRHREALVAARHLVPARPAPLPRTADNNHYVKSCRKFRTGARRAGQAAPLLFLAVTTK